MVIKSDDELGGASEKYWWGQNEQEVLIKCRGPKTLKSKAAAPHSHPPTELRAEATTPLKRQRNAVPPNG